jgi:hypothetical protein
MRTAALACLLAAASLIGCGSPRSPLLSGGQNRLVGGSAGYTAPDPPKGLVDCLRLQGVNAVKVGPSLVRVGPPEVGLSVTFPANGAVAEAKQARGEAEGAELVGGGLVRIGSADDGLLAKVEGCLGVR